MRNRKNTKDEVIEQIAQECVAVRLRMLTRAVTRVYNAALRPHSLTVSQMNILVTVSYLGEAKQQDVCRYLQLEKSTLSRDIERMRAQGWLQSVPSEDDARSILLNVTTAGRRLLETAYPAWQQAQQKVMALFGESTVNALQQAAKSLGSTPNKMFK